MAHELHKGEKSGIFEGRCDRRGKSSRNGEDRRFSSSNTQTHSGGDLGHNVVLVVLKSPY